MENLAEERPDAPKPGMKIGARPRFENVQGQRRIFQISLGCLSTNSSKGKNSNTPRTKLSPKESLHPTGEKNEMPHCISKQALSPDSNELQNGDESNYDFPSKRISVTPIQPRKPTCVEYKAVKPFSKVSSRGRGRGLRHSRVPIPGERPKSNANIIVNELKSNATAVAQNLPSYLKQDQAMTVMTLNHEVVNGKTSRENIAILPDLPDLIKCQSQQENENRFEPSLDCDAMEEAYESDSSYVDVDSDDQNTELSNASAPVLRRKSTRQNYLDSSSSDHDQREKIKPCLKRNRVRAVKKSLSRSSINKPSPSHKLKKPSQSRAASKDTENPNKMTLSQSIVFTCSSKPKENATTSKNYLREKTNVQLQDEENAEKSSLESAPAFISVTAQIEPKDSKRNAISVCDNIKKGVEISSKRLKHLASTGLTEATNETLTVDNMTNQDNMSSKVLSSSVCAKVAALYHTFQAENGKEVNKLVASQNVDLHVTKAAIGRTISTGDQELKTADNAGAIDIHVLNQNSMTQITSPCESWNRNTEKKMSSVVMGSLVEDTDKKHPEKIQTSMHSSLGDCKKSQAKKDSVTQRAKTKEEHKVKTDMQTTNHDKVKENIHGNNLHLTKRKEQEECFKEVKGIGKGSKKVNNKNISSDLKNERKSESHSMVAGNDEQFRSEGASHKASHEKFCQTVEEVSVSDELECALKLESISISDHLQSSSVEKCNKGNEKKSLEEVGTNRVNENHLTKSKNNPSSMPREDLDIPQIESPLSPCARASSDCISEPEMEMDSQSESEFYLPEHENGISSQGQGQHESMGLEVSFSKFHQHPVNPIMPDISGYWANRFPGYSNHPRPAFSTMPQFEDQMCLPAHEFHEQSEQVSAFWKFCSEKIKQRSSFYQGYYPLDVRIKVKLVPKVHPNRPCDQEPKPSRSGYAPYVDPYFPPGFPHPHLMWPGPGAWSDFRSHHMDASSADARNFYPPDPCHTRPRELPALPPFNPQFCNPYNFASYRNLHDSMKRSYEASQCLSHTSELRGPSMTVSSASSPEDGKEANDGEQQQTLGATPKRFISSCKAKNENDSIRSDTVSTSKTSATKKAQVQPMNAFGMSAFLTPERLHNPVDEIRRFQPSISARQGHITGYKPALKRTFSNPEVDKSVSPLALIRESPIVVDKKSQHVMGNDGIQSNRPDTDPKCSPENDFVLHKKKKCADAKGLDEAKQDAINAVTGFKKNIDAQSQNSLPVHDTLAMGSNAPNWRDHCRPNGNAQSSPIPFSMQFMGLNKPNFKRRSYCNAEMGGNTPDDAKLPRINKGRRSDPGTFQMDAAAVKRERWLTSFQHRSRGYQLPFIDTHCHIDFLYQRLGVDSFTPFRMFRAENHQYFPHNYEGCIAIFCNPKTFAYSNPNNAVLKMVEKEEQVWIALGCHPKNAEDFNSYHLHGLRLALLSPKVVALGEIGLDYSGHYHKSSETQKSVFIQQLNLALNMQLPLVIHCREADDDCLEILQKIVPKEHKIHAHCFTRGKDVAQRWLDAFPNLWLGFTPLVTYKSAVDVTEAVAHIPLNRLLLETDAPYFVPGSLKDANVHFSYPGFALVTAEAIAFQKGIPVAEVLKACRQNTRDMYGI